MREVLTALLALLALSACARDESPDPVRPLEARKPDPLLFLSTMTLRLDPGSYRLVSSQRPCDGSCDSLDPPTDECSREVVVTAGRSVAVTITVGPGESCSVEVEQQ